MSATSLTWSSDASVLATALKQAYPDEAVSALGVETLREKLLALPTFFGDATPPDARYLQHILWTWMRAAAADESVGGD